MPIKNRRATSPTKISSGSSQELSVKKGVLKRAIVPNLTWPAAFEARTDLTKFGDNALGLFALAIRFRMEDLESVAANSLTDGNDDKKCDIVFTDKDNGVAVIAQCYHAQVPGVAAPSNKASDLNTAVAWILQRKLSELPTRLQSAAAELRSAIHAGQIVTLNIWYVHNCPESKNAAEELRTAEHTASAIIERNFSTKTIVSANEVGTNTFERWYKETLSPILVENEFVIKVASFLEVEGPEWRAIVAAIPATFLRKVYANHRTDIFSANVRDYLGSRSSDSNINNQIKLTAENQPENFWVFNNGVTILCHKVKPQRTKGLRTTLRVTGMSIVNGAQTTGALGSLSKQIRGSAEVLARFVETSNTEIVQNIIRYNNSQNKVTASDFRSTDAIQRRLQKEMEKVPEAEYEGGRRGGYGDAIKRRPNLLPSYTVGQALSGLHGDAITAYNAKSEIWINDRLYARVFNTDVTAPHIVFAYTLLKCIEQKKLSLVQKSKDGTLTSLEADQLSFFRQRGAMYLLLAAIAACVETFFGSKVANLFYIQFTKNVSPDKGIRIWEPVVAAVMPLCNQLADGLTDGLKSSEKVAAAIARFKQLVAATSSGNLLIYKSFSEQVRF